MRRVLASLVLAVLVVTTSFAESPERLSGIYSSLYYNQEGGDLLGTEIMIFPSGRGPDLEYFALVQVAEGGAPSAALVTLKEKDGKVEFVFPAKNGAPEMPFTGVIKKGELVLRWFNGNEERLKRGKSYWQ